MVKVSPNNPAGEVPRGLRTAPVTDEPSQVKNNIDQVLQPTGDGGVAGGRIPPVGAAGNEPGELPPTENAKRYRENIRLGEQANARVNMTPSDVKMVKVTLQNHYVPEGEYEIVGDAPKPALAGTGVGNKLLKGTTVRLPSDEAKRLYDSQRATRAFDD